MTDHRDWQRRTALQHVERQRAEQTGAAVPDRHLAAKAATYVGTSTDQVLAWMRGAK